jgi:outer membrane protein assembly factor BamA
VLLTVIPLLFFSCNATRYVQEDEYLLHDYRIEIDNGKLDKKELNGYIKQKPNKRILFWRFYLSLYNLSSPEKDNGFNRWLKRIGEPPVVYDSGLKERSAEQLKLYMRNKGYYHAQVSDTTYFRNQRARVLYRIDPDKPYRIRDISYFFHDASLASPVLKDTASSVIRQGDLLDVDLLEKERQRIEGILRDSGYYHFDSEYIYYEVDSTLSGNLVDVTLNIRNYPVQGSNGRIIHTDHPVYRIRNVYLVTEYNADRINWNGTKDPGLADTVVYDNVHVVYKGEPDIRPSVVTQKNYIMPGDLYNATNESNTYRNLSSLSAFRTVEIRFSEVGERSNLLDAEVLIVPATRQSFTVRLEGTNSGGNIGAAGNLTYRHMNLFGRSEQFDLSFTGAIETLRETGTSGYGNLLEFGVEGRLRIPKFLLPFRTDQFIRSFNPQTNIRLSLNFQQRPDYSRTLVNATFGYNWKGRGNFSHLVYPLETSLILTPYKSPEFQDWLEGKYLFYSYEPHLIIDSRYTMIFTNQKLLKNQDFQNVRLNLESAGNLLYSGYRLFAPGQTTGEYQLFGVDFSQYVKADVDFRDYNFFYEDISLVFRGFAGAAIPYLNSGAVPFEKQYFSGGANSIRAWQVKNLGPGSFNDTTRTTYPNQTGDLKLEVNLEYRFKLFWKLETAIFLDAGNIWSLSEDDDREGARFAFDRFHRELAVGTGFGTRFVFNFFILRFDLGVPLRNPYPIEGSQWLPGNAGISGRDLTFNIAIGYPF